MTDPFFDVEEFATQAAQAATDLRAAIDRANLGHDRHVWEGLAITLELLPEHARLVWAKAGEASLSPEVVADLIRRLEIAVEAGGQAGMRREAARLVRTADRRLSALVGVAIGAAFVAGYVAALVAIHFGGWP